MSGVRMLVGSLLPQSVVVARRPGNLSTTKNRSPQSRKRRLGRTTLSLYTALGLLLVLYLFFWMITSYVGSLQEMTGSTEGDQQQLQLKQRAQLLQSPPNDSSKSSSSKLIRDNQKYNHPFFKDSVQLQQQQQQKQQQIIAENTVNLPLSSSSSHHQQQQQQLFLNYQLYRNRPYNITYGSFTTCPLGITTNKWGRKPIERVPLSTTFQNILNISTYLQTNLKILILGDSVGIQFFQLLEEAAEEEKEDGRHHHPSTSTSRNDYRTIYKYAWGAHESVSIAAPIHGGGVIAGFRMTGMFLKKNLGKPPPNAAGGGWLRDDTELLLNHSYYSPQQQLSTTSTTTVQQFDSMIFRIPHGWLQLNEITRETLMETLELSHEIFGVRTIIIMTLPLNNNVKTIEELEQLHIINHMIRDVVDHWQEYRSNRSSSGLEHVLLMDFGKWVMDLTELNSKLLLKWDITRSNYTLDRLGCTRYPPSIAMICTNPNVTIGSCTCKRNRISIDGMHWCMESVGGRSIAAMACLLQCPLLVLQNNNSSNTNTNNIKTCEQGCNNRFMSLTPVEMLF